MARPTILLVDNDQDFLMPATAFLERAGYKVECATSPEAAIKILKQKTIAMALLDYRLRCENDDNDNSGLLLALEMMKHFPIPRIVMTKHRDDYKYPREVMGRREGGEYAAHYFLHKSEGLDAMVAVIKRLLSQASIFLSYASDDLKKVEKLFEKLTQEDFLPWMNTTGIVGGEQWEDVLQQEISSRDFFIACVSNQSIKKRGFMQKEYNWGFAKREGKKPRDIYFIPVRLEKLEDEIDDPRFDKLHWINLYEKDGFQRLVAALREGIDRRY